MPISEKESFEYNPNYVRRDQLLGISDPKWDEYIDWVEHIESITLEIFGKLLAEKFVDPDDSQENSPTSSEFFEFMHKHPGTTAHGYAISPYRDDFRVTIEGLCVKGVSSVYDIRPDFIHFCASADYLVIDFNYLFSWWD